RLLQNLKQAHSPSYAHCLRVGEVVSTLARDQADADELFISGVLHDIGKRYAPIPALLDTPARLTLDQIETVHAHSSHGMEDILQAVRQTDDATTEKQSLARAAFVAYYHHADFDQLESLQPTAS